MSIYLDNAATTAVYEKVISEMDEVMRASYANPASVHAMGRKACAYLEEARDIMAEELHCEAKELYFTSGGTEADNIAVIGYARANRQKGRHVIVSAIEHHAVLNSAAELEREGFIVSYISPEKNGVVDIEKIKDAIRDDTILISLMYVNNELGTFQPIDEAAELAKEKGIAFHTDAVQAFGKYDIDVKKSAVSMLSASSHKLHGPKGAGLVYINKDISVENVIYGGGQERGKRSGTVNVPAVFGFAKATELSRVWRKEKELRVKKLSEELFEGISESGALINGEDEKRSGYILNVLLPGIQTADLLYRLDYAGLCVSAGSACTAGSIEATHVIRAIGREESGASVRFSLSEFTTEEEIKEAAEIFVREVAKLKA